MNFVKILFTHNILLDVSSPFLLEQGPFLRVIRGFQLINYSKFFAETKKFLNTLNKPLLMPKFIKNSQKPENVSILPP